jgi:prefoldin subunit 4
MPETFTQSLVHYQEKLEQVDDASTELMMGNECKVMLFLGDAFFETHEEQATEHCEAVVEKYQSKVDELNLEEESITRKQSELKKLLYARFGASINLEE